MSDQVKVEVLTKQGCHLCEDAVEVARQACAEFGLDHHIVDITEDPQLRELYAEEIPVLRIDGTVRDFWRFDPARLRRLLAEALGRSSG